MGGCVDGYFVRGSRAAKGPRGSRGQPPRPEPPDSALDESGAAASGFQVGAKDAQVASCKARVRVAGKSDRRDQIPRSLTGDTASQPPQVIVVVRWKRHAACPLALHFREMGRGDHTD